MTVNRESIAELEEKKSRFIAVLVPIDRFEARLDALRTEHRKASHHVTAFRAMRSDGRIEEGARDDGEPAGTSGMPVLRTMIGAGVVDAGLIVVRYFGGTKLGAGGLSRAYSGAAKRAIDAATLVPWVRIVQRTLSCPFADMSKVEQRIGDMAITVVERTYTASGVDLVVAGPEDRLDMLEK